MTNAALRIPRIHDGPAAIERWPGSVRRFGARALWVTGSHSYDAAPWGALLERGCAAAGLERRRLRVAGEPSPETVDRTVAEHRSDPPEVVVAVGGGSAIDTAKAIAALLPSGRSVFDHLEGVGRGVPFEGPTIPFLAAPTSAGSGAEATMNAVLSERGPGGFKKSFRHPSLVAREVMLDPRVLEGGTGNWIAAEGMDARTQLIESYLSPRATASTRAWVTRWLPGTATALFRCVSGQGTTADRMRLQRAAFASGVALARTGLGAVHGLAAPLGAFHPVPHAVVCGTLLDASLRVTLDALRERAPDDPALGRLCELAALEGHRGDGAVDAWFRSLTDLRERTGIPRLSRFGISEADTAAVVQASGGRSMQTHPLPLTEEELAGILRSRL